MSGDRSGAEDEEARRTQGERLREYFAAQLLFAERLTQLAPIGLAEACLRFTNLHIRFGLGRASGERVHEDWQGYAAGLSACATLEQRLDWTVEFFVQSSPAPVRAIAFGCFAFDPPAIDGAVRIHFTNRDSADGTGPLVASKADRRRAELRDMFSHVRANFPDARLVRGGSWLYNLTAYCRLFPPQYVASRFEPEHVRLDGTSSWGQLLDHRGQVKSQVCSALQANLTTLDPDAPWKAFPLLAIGALSPIDDFYEFYAR